MFRGMGVGAGVVRFGATWFDVDNYVRDGLRGETLLYTKFMIVLSSTEPEHMWSAAMAVRDCVAVVVVKDLTRPWRRQLLTKRNIFIYEIVRWSAQSMGAVAILRNDERLGKLLGGSSWDQIDLHPFKRLQ